MTNSLSAYVNCALELHAACQTLCMHSPFPYKRLRLTRYTPKFSGYSSQSHIGFAKKQRIKTNRKKPHPLTWKNTGETFL